MFSSGKDSVTCLDILVNRMHVHPLLIYWNMQPFFMEHNKKVIEYYANRYKCEYKVVAHYDKIAKIMKLQNKRVPTYKEWLLKLYYDNQEKIQVFGIKASDNLIAKMLVNKGERLALNRVYPLWNWKDLHVWGYIEENKIPVKASYHNGIRDINEYENKSSLEWLKRTSLIDYERLLELEPWRIAYADKE